VILVQAILRLLYLLFIDPMRFQSYEPSDWVECSYGSPNDKPVASILIVKIFVCLLSLEVVVRSKEPIDVIKSVQERGEEAGP